MTHKKLLIISIFVIIGVITILACIQVVIFTVLFGGRSYPVSPLKEYNLVFNDSPRRVKKTGIVLSEKEHDTKTGWTSYIGSPVILNRESNTCFSFNQTALLVRMNITIPCDESEKQELIVSIISMIKEDYGSKKGFYYTEKKNEQGSITSYDLGINLGATKVSFTITPDIEGIHISCFDLY